MLRLFLTALCQSISLACLAPAIASAQVMAGPDYATRPDYATQLMLIRNTIALVNHGNLTGNYTVLRDLASDRLRQRSTASDLAATFSNLRQQKLDLSPILVIEPQLTQPPQETSPGRLLLVGQFPTQPRNVRFALVFQRVAAGWMIDEISLDVMQPQPHVASAPGANPAVVVQPPTPNNIPAASYRAPVR